MAVHKSDRLKKELEATLSRELGRVKAPAELWDRIRNRQAAQSTQERDSGSPRQWVWALAAAAAVAAMVVVTLGLRARAPVTREELAVRGLGGDHLDFRSGEANEVRRWVAAKTGLDVPLAGRPALPVELMGARVVNGNA